MESGSHAETNAGSSGTVCFGRFDKEESLAGGSLSNITVQPILFRRNTRENSGLRVPWLDLNA